MYGVDQVINKKYEVVSLQTNLGLFDMFRCYNCQVSVLRGEKELNIRKVVPKVNPPRTMKMHIQKTKKLVT